MNHRLFAFLLALPLLLACHHGSDGGGVIGSSLPILGSGLIVSENRPVPPFDSVDLQAVAGVTITLGSSHGVRVEADDNIIDHIGTRVAGSVLVIDSDASYDSPSGVKVYLEANAARSLRLTGVGSITATGIASSGTVSATVTGVGTITPVGYADAFVGTLTGVGRIEALDLMTRRSTIVISGQGDCRVTAGDELDVTISGIGDVYYAGNPPLVRSTITGRGRLIPI